MMSIDVATRPRSRASSRWRRGPSGSRSQPVEAVEHFDRVRLKRVSHQWANTPSRDTERSWWRSPAATSRHRSSRTRAEVRRRGHPGLAEDHRRHRRPRRRLRAMAGEEPGDRVGRAGRLRGDAVGCLAPRASTRPPADRGLGAMRRRRRWRSLWPPRPGRPPAPDDPVWPSQRLPRPLWHRSTGPSRAGGGPPPEVALLVEHRGRVKRRWLMP
jgi:hypothetical protein